MHEPLEECLFHFSELRFLLELVAPLIKSFFFLLHQVSFVIKDHTLLRLVLAEDQVIVLVK